MTGWWVGLGVALGVVLGFRWLLDRAIAVEEQHEREGRR